MELLFSDNPLIQTVTQTKSISSMYKDLVDSATQFNRVSRKTQLHPSPLRHIIS